MSSQTRTKQIEVNGKQIRIDFNYTRLDLAMSALRMTIQQHTNMALVLGDHDENGENGQIWMVTCANAQRLERAGYTAIYH